MIWLDKLKLLEEGYQEVYFRKQRYSLTKSTFNQGKSIKVFAKDLGGNNFISCNVYEIQSGHLLKPCEMPREKVIEFLESFEF